MIPKPLKTVLFMVMIGGGFSLGPAIAQQPLPAPRAIGLEELLSQAAALVADERYAEAIPSIRQLIDALDHAAADENRPLLEKALLSLAVACLETDQATQAAATLERFLNEFPESTQRRAAELLLIEAMVAEQRWEDVVKRADRLLAEPALTDRERLMLNHARGEALYVRERWGAAIDPLQYVLRESPDDVIRNDAAVLVAICLLESQPVEAFFRFWPELERLPARYDARLALGLLKAADRHHAEGQAAEALRLYRMVYPKREIEAQITQQLEQLEQIRRRMDAEQELDPAQARARRREVDRQILRLKSDRADLARVEEYAPAVALRSARIHLGEQRYADAYRLFQTVYRDYPEHPLAEEALYSAFGTGQQAGDPAGAIAAGELYLRSYPDGRFWDEVTLALTTLRLAQEQWREAVTLAQEAIRVHPDHSHYDQLLYSAGYGLFQLEEFDQARQQFGRILDAYPQSAFVEPARYWHATCDLFLGRYPAAETEYETFLAEHKDGELYADAFYRLALAQSGAAKTEAAKQTLEQFLAAFPGHGLAADAHSMLGDLYAANGELDKAVTAFTRAIDAAKQDPQVDYATFQLARVYGLAQRHEPVIALCREYLARSPTSARVSEGSYWLGHAQLALGNNDAALATYFDAIARYGNRPGDDGVDLMLRDLVKESLAGSLGPLAPQIRRRLQQELDHSRQTKQRTLELRLVAALVEITRDSDRRQVLIDRLLAERDLAILSPLTLIVMGQESRLRQFPERAAQTCDYLLAHHDRSDWALLGRMELAELKIGSSQYDEALELLAEAINRSPAGQLAGAATRRQADVLRRQGRHEEAVARYASILGVREWRGELWAASLFGIGESFREQKAIEKAFAYYQRVYVLYEGYPQWAARAYVRSAECLVELGRVDEAVATYREMLSKKSLAMFPEWQMAEDALARLSGNT